MFTLEENVIESTIFLVILVEFIPLSQQKSYIASCIFFVAVAASVYFDAIVPAALLLLLLLLIAFDSFLIV
jgi:hypothetical protein